MKKVLKTAGLFIFALCLVLSGFLITPVRDAEANGDHIYLPTLTAEITSPANNTTVQVGNCFTVTATITITCPDVQINKFDSFPFVRPVHAFTESCAIENVQATIEIQGNAAVQGAATQSASSGLDCPNGRAICPGQVTVNWQVCCTGPGAVTITVTPYGQYTISAAKAPAIFVQPVYAIPYSPLPDDHLVSDSITIMQIPRDDFYEKWLMDSSGGSWAKPHYIKPTNVWAQPQTLLAGQNVTIYVNMANRGDIEGPYTATLKINGVEEAVKSGVLAGNTATPLEFVVSRDEPGAYEVDINGQKTFFTVVGDSAKEETSINNNRTLLLLWSFLLVALIIALVIMLLRRRRYDN